MPEDVPCSEVAARRATALNALDLFPELAEHTQLAASELASFDALWSLDTAWHEAPNERRGGWSGVSRHLLADGSAIFVKRQDQHLWRTARHPLRVSARDSDQLMRRVAGWSDDDRSDFSTAYGQQCKALRR